MSISDDEESKLSDVSDTIKSCNWSGGEWGNTDNATEDESLCKNPDFPCSWQRHHTIFNGQKKCYAKRLKSDGLPPAGSSDPMGHGSKIPQETRETMQQLQKTIADQAKTLATKAKKTLTGATTPQEQHTGDQNIGGNKSRKHKSRKHKSRKHKSRKHKSRKHKSRKHKSRKHKSRKY